MIQDSAIETELERSRSAERTIAGLQQRVEALEAAADNDEYSMRTVDAIGRILLSELQTTYSDVETVTQKTEISIEIKRLCVTRLTEITTVSPEVVGASNPAIAALAEALVQEDRLPVQDILRAFERSAPHLNIHADTKSVVWTVVCERFADNRTRTRARCISILCGVVESEGSSDTDDSIEQTKIDWITAMLSDILRRDHSFKLNKQAAEGIGTIAAAGVSVDQRIIENLIGAANADRKSVSQAAVRALGPTIQHAETKSPDWLDALYQASEGPRNTRQAAASSLGRVAIGAPQFKYDKTLITTLLELLFDSDQYVRGEALPAVEKLVGSGTPLRWMVFEWLRSQIEAKQGTDRLATPPEIFAYPIENGSPELARVLADPLIGLSLYPTTEIGEAACNLLAGLLNSECATANEIFRDKLSNLATTIVRSTDDERNPAPDELEVLVRIAEVAPSTVAPHRDILYDAMWSPDTAAPASDVLEELVLNDPQILPENRERVEQMLNADAQSLQQNALNHVTAFARSAASTKQNTEFASDILPVLVDLTDSSSSETRQWAGKAIKHLAKSYPDIFEETITALISSLNDEAVGFEIQRALEFLVEQRPDVVAARSERLGRFINATPQKVQERGLAVIQTLVTRASHITTNTDVYDELRELAPRCTTTLAAEEIQRQPRVATVLGQLASLDPSLVIDDIPLLVRALCVLEDVDAMEEITKGLVIVAERHPTAVHSQASILVSHIQTSNKRTRIHLARILIAALSQQYQWVDSSTQTALYDTLTEVVPTISETLSTDLNDSETALIRLLDTIAGEYPEIVATETETYLNILANSDPVWGNEEPLDELGTLLETIGAGHPAPLLDHCDTLKTQFETGFDETQQIIASVLRSIIRGLEYPASLPPAITQFAPVLARIESRDPDTRKEALRTLSTITQADPSAARSEVKPLIEIFSETTYTSQEVEKSAAECLLHVARAYPTELTPHSAEIESSIKDRNTPNDRDIATVLSQILETCNNAATAATLPHPLYDTGTGPDHETGRPTADPVDQLLADYLEFSNAHPDPSVVEERDTDIVAALGQWVNENPESVDAEFLSNLSKMVFMEEYYPEIVVPFRNIINKDPMALTQPAIFACFRILADGFLGQTRRPFDAALRDLAAAHPERCYTTAANALVHQQGYSDKAVWLLGETAAQAPHLIDARMLELVVDQLGTSDRVHKCSIHALNNIAVHANDQLAKRAYRVINDQLSGEEIDSNALSAMQDVAQSRPDFISADVVAELETVLDDNQSIGEGTQLTEQTMDCLTTIAVNAPDTFLSHSEMLLPLSTQLSSEYTVRLLRAISDAVQLMKDDTSQISSALVTDALNDESINPEARVLLVTIAISVSSEATLSTDSF